MTLTAAPFHFGRCSHHQDTRLDGRVSMAKAAAEHIQCVGRGCEKQCQPREEMPGPDFTLWQNRCEPLRHGGKQRIGSDPNAGKQADDEGERRQPV